MKIIDSIQTKAWNIYERFYKRNLLFKFGSSHKHTNMLKGEIAYAYMIDKL
jgi:hypothetical protein